jgi:hypothetical protein
MILEPSVQHVLVFAEHAPSREELAQVVEQLSEFRGGVLTAVLHHNPMPGRERVDEHGGATHQQLEDLVDALRAAGHQVTGELVSGDVEHALLTEIRLRGADAVVLMPGRHLVAHLAHRDLEHHLRHHTAVPVVAVTGRGVPHLV